MEHPLQGGEMDGTQSGDFAILKTVCLNCRGKMDLWRDGAPELHLAASVKAKAVLSWASRKKSREGFPPLVLRRY